MDNKEIYNVTRKSYNQVAEVFSKKHSNLKPIIPLTKPFVEKIPMNGRILDAGCGHGRDVSLFSQLGFEVIGVDFSEEMVRLAKAETGAKIYLMDLRNIDFPNNFFDAIWANACLHHLTEVDTKLVLSEFYRVLKPGGVVFASLKKGSHSGFDREYRDCPRYFYLQYKKDIEELFELSNLNIYLSHTHKDGDGHPTWVHLYAVKPRITQLQFDFGCRLCEVVHNISTTTTVPIYDQPIIQTSNFYVCLALGQIAPGYLLLISKKHMPCLGALSANLWNELEELKIKIRKLLEPRFGPTVLFEHGSFSETVQAGNSVVHAHLHVVPAPMSFIRMVIKKLNCQRINNRAFAMQSYLNCKAYMLIEDHKEQGYGCNPPNGCPSQYFRRHLANSIGIGCEWNWKFHPHHDKIDETVKKLQENL